MVRISTITPQLVKLYTQLFCQIQIIRTYIFQFYKNDITIFRFLPNKYRLTVVNYDFT